MTWREPTMPFLWRDGTLDERPTPLRGLLPMVYEVAVLVDDLGRLRNALRDNPEPVHVERRVFHLERLRLDRREMSIYVESGASDAVHAFETWLGVGE